MAEPFLSLSWRDHSNNLATLCKSSLDDNFLVDCTLAAEGQSLKAHRLILSACSPYFQMLFSEEREKHPIVILSDTLFDTLKAVIDYVYHGEIQIAEGQLEAFLALADSLKIKGLKNSLSIKNPQIVFDDNLGTCDVQASSVNHEDSSRNCHLSLCPESYVDALQSNTSVSPEECSDSCEKVQLSMVLTPSQEQQISFVCEEHCSDTEITVKHEPLYPEFLESRDDMLGGVGSDEPMSGNFASEKKEGTVFVFDEEDLNQTSRNEHSCCGRMESAPLVIPHQLHQQQKAMLDKAATDANCAEQTEALLPVIWVPKKEQMDAEKEYIQDMLQNNANALDHVTEPGRGGQIINECPSAAKVRKAARGRGRGRAAGQRAEGRMSLPSVARPFRCTLCPADFTSRSCLYYHKRKHTVGLPHLCDVCGSAFAELSILRTHKRTHTGERPYSCDVCGAAFAQSSTLITHKRTHTGERPYKCDVCGETFKKQNVLNRHLRIHTGERPYSCDVCGADFNRSTHLTGHMRTHTGEHLYSCDACGKTFAHLHSLTHHKRTHTGERPYSCDVCGVAYAYLSSLTAHKRNHTGERPYKCEACGEAFKEKRVLKKHMRIHTGVPPSFCNV